MPRINSRALKVSCVLDPNEIAAIPDIGTARVVLHIAVQDFATITADVASKSLRKAQNLIAEHGGEAVAVIIQGKLLNGNRIAEARLVAQVKAPKPQMETAT